MKKTLFKTKATSMENGPSIQSGIDIISANSISPKLIINDRQWRWSWKKIGTSYRDTKQDEKLKANIWNLIYNIAFTYFGRYSISRLF